MIDRALSRKIAEEGPDDEEIPVTRRWLKQVLGELESAKAELAADRAVRGRCFGLAPGMTL